MAIHLTDYKEIALSINRHFKERLTNTILNRKEKKGIEPIKMNQYLLILMSFRISGLNSKKK